MSDVVGWLTLAGESGRSAEASLTDFRHQIIGAIQHLDEALGELNRKRARWRIILRCETGGTFSNSVVGAAGETSGFQIHPPSHPWYDEDRGHVDAYYGALSAKRVLHSQGWGAWTCARINGLA